VCGLLFSALSLKGMQNPKMENPKIVITKAEDIRQLIDARNKQYPKRSRNLLGEKTGLRTDTLEVKPHQLPRHEHIPVSINNNIK